VTEDADKAEPQQKRPEEVGIEKESEINQEQKKITGNEVFGDTLYIGSGKMRPMG
jgi:hypothetical protein